MYYLSEKQERSVKVSPYYPFNVILNAKLVHAITYVKAGVNNHFLTNILFSVMNLIRVNTTVCHDKRLFFSLCL